MNIQYSDQLLKDFHELIGYFTHFMSWGMIHLAQGSPAEHVDKANEITSESSNHIHALNNIFKVPLMNYRNHNKDIFEKNFGKILKWMHSYLRFVKPRLEKCNPAVYNGSFKSLKDKYEEFVHEYGLIKYR